MPALTDSMVHAAALNNALWCDTMYRLHHRPGQLQEACWITRHAPLPFYPNVVTLTPGIAPARYSAIINALCIAGLTGEWGVKDSFAQLDLHALQFRILFEGTWFWRAPARVAQDGALAALRWTTLTRDAELAAWERAWRAASPGPDLRLFQPALLAEPHIAVIASYQGAQIVAGAIACRSAGAVGCSNMFVPAHAARHFQQGCLAAVMAAFPDVPLVGYSSGPAEVVRQLACEPIGRMRVWLHKPSASP